MDDAKTGAPWRPEPGDGAALVKAVRRGECGPADLRLMAQRAELALQEQRISRLLSEIVRLRETVTVSAAPKSAGDLGRQLGARMAAASRHRLKHNPVTRAIRSVLAARAGCRLPVQLDVAPPRDYAQFKSDIQVARAAERREIDDHMTAMVVKPTFLILIQAGGVGDIDRTVASLHRQVYGHCSVHVGNDAQRLYDADMIADDDFLLVLDAGQVLDEFALYELASAINAAPDVDLIYFDEDYMLDDGGIRPFFKPDWSPDYLESYNYVRNAACYRIATLTSLPEPADIYDLVLRFTEIAGKIVHLRQALLSAPFARPTAEYHAAAAALEGRLARTGRKGAVQTVDTISGPLLRHRVDLSSRPLVSIVIPTAARSIEIEGRQIDLIVNCIDQIVRHSSYDNYEIIVVDNGDLAPSQREWLDRHGCRSITYRSQTFNVAEKLNLGATIASGEVLLLLNDDIEIVTPDWIEIMLAQLEKPHVGVVGAKLIYPDLRLQHVGIVHNHGNPDHVRQLYPRDDDGYFNSSMADRNYMAVTGACMMTPASVFEKVGGYTAALAVSFNDVDYCLKVKEAGLVSVYAAQAELIHMESQSRVPVLDLTELNYFQRRWARHIAQDPFYNEQMLTLARPTYEIAIASHMV